MKSLSEVEAKSSAAVQSPGARARQRFWRNYASWAGMGLVTAFLLMALGAEVLSPYSLAHSAKDEAGLRITEPPTWQYWLGTDANAKDLVTRVMHGSRLSLLAGVVSILLAVAVGV